MSTKEKPGQFDCYARALPDEPYFILLARDPFAPILVKMWAAWRWLDIRLGNRPSEDRLMVDESLECAQQMIEWREANDGNWRHFKDQAWVRTDPTPSEDKA